MPQDRRNARNSFLKISDVAVDAKNLLLAPLPGSIRSRLRNSFRSVTSPIRALPSYLIVGAQKAGTSALSNFLGQHPDILPSKPKEVHYFDINYARSKGWYLTHFPLKAQLGSHRITGEASPYYMFHPHAMERIKTVLPDVKIIIMLRNPVSRAISQYFKSLKSGVETLPMEEAMRTEEVRLKDEYDAMIADPSYQSRHYQSLSYKARGIYYPQVKRCLDLFGREQVLVLKSEDMLSDKARSVLREVFSFLEVDEDFVIPDMEPKNVGKSRYTSDVPAEVTEYLSEFFKPHNKQLYEYLDRDFGW
jgi:hypothetical protein